MPREYFTDFPVCATIKELILDGFERGGEKRQFLFRDENGEEKEKRFCDVAEDTAALGAFLRSRGFGAGSKIAILSENCYFWNVVFYAVQCNGSVAVPLEPALPADELAGQMANCGCDAVFYSAAQAEKVAFARSLPDCTLAGCFSMENPALLLAAGEEAPPEARRTWSAAPVAPEDLACIVYTSGTTGKTKGVMLTHKNICSNVYSLLHVATGGHGIGFLPLNHTYSWVTGLFATLVKTEWGYICTSLRRIYKDIKEYQPTQFAAVPMVVEMIYQNIILTAKRNGTYDKLMQGINTSRNFMLSGYDARREIFSDIHEKLGGKLECIFCGGAYLSPEIEEFMYDIGIQIRTGYGLTECSPIVTCARRYEYKFGSVGLPLECCEIMIHAPDAEGVGEIYVKGDNVMAGYYGDPEATAAAFDGDWLKTGDYGKIDEEGYLWFSGRKKNLIILSNGKNVSPEIIEGKLVSAIHYVKEALVFEKDNHICAELYLDEEEGPEMKDHLAEDVEAVNASLADFMRISSFTVRDTEFPKTATLKIKRGEAQAARQVPSV